MARLVVNPDTPEAWVIELKPGENSLGRGEENDFQVEHASVSSQHCRIVICGETATLRDLGSTSGTFLDGQLIEEAVLGSGQVFQLGDVRMRLEAGPGPEPLGPGETAMAQAPLPSSAGGGHCARHPHVMARFACPACGGRFCGWCIQRTPVEGEERPYCRACGVECGPLAFEEGGHREQSFAVRLGGAFLYPVKKDGVILLVTGTVFFSLIGGLEFFARFAATRGIGLGAAISGALLLLLGAFGAGYLTSYLLPRFLPWPVVPAVLSSFVGLYLLTVEARVLGVLYHANQGRLNWFGHR